MIAQITDAPPPVDRRTRWSLTHLGLTLAVVVPVALFFAPLPLDAPVQSALAITSFMLLAWMAEIMDPALVGLIGCYLFWALGVVPFGTAFSGFATDTAWFAFGATLFGAMTVKSGLGRRLALQILKYVGGTYESVLMGLVIASLVLTFVVPSGAARVVIMATVALGMIEALGLTRSNQAAAGMFVAISYGAGLFDKMIIAGTAVITAQGLMERVGGIPVLWSRWFVAFLPASLITIPVLWRVTLWLHPSDAGGRTATEYMRRELAELGPWTAIEKRTTLLLLAAVALWVTDFAHHLSPQMIGLGVGLCAVLPGIGVLTTDDVKRVNYLPVFFVAAALSMGEVLIATKTLNLVIDEMFAWMQPLMTGTFSSTAVMYWGGFIYHLFLGSEVSMLGTSIPLMMQFATTHGLDPLATGMVWTFSASARLFAYQSAVLVIGYSYGFFQARDLFRLGLVMSVVEFVILVLLRHLYWPLLGLH